MRLKLAALVAATVLLTFAPGLAAPAYPEKALEIIAPAGAGGGWDLTARMVARALAEEKLVTVPITVTNMPGGSGAVGIAHMVTRRKGDAHVLAVMGSSLTGTLARKAVPYSFKDVVPIAALTGDFMVIAVRKDSSFTRLRVLMDVYRRDPGLITVGGGSAPGSLDHIAFALLGKKVGVDTTKVRYVPFDGGAQAMAALLGGSITVLSTSLSEVLPNLEAGQIRVLGITAPERLGGNLRSIPTALEQGVDFVYVNWRGFYMPPDTPASVVRYWETTLERMARSRAWAKILDEMKWAPFLLTGERFRRFLDEDLSSTESALRDLGLVR